MAFINILYFLSCVAWKWFVQFKHTVKMPRTLFNMQSQDLLKRCESWAENIRFTISCETRINKTEKGFNFRTIFKFVLLYIATENWFHLETETWTFKINL